MKIPGFEVIPVSETIWCVRRASYLTCAYIVAADAGIVLVDAGMDSGGDDMRDALKQIGRGDEPIVAILLTHWHNDHAAGAQAIKEATGAKVFYHVADAPYYTRQTVHPGFRGWLSDIIPEHGVFVLAKGLLGEATPRAVAADVLVEDGQTILNDFEVILTPGHTPGHVSFYYHPARALFAGDALAVIGEQVRCMARAVTPDLPQAHASMLRCLARDIAILCPGHRQPLTQNVAVRCQALKIYLEQGGKWPLLG